ncbi:MAG: hypothetical protein DMF60_22190, partial [Acidobacteria bacterium]
VFKLGARDSLMIVGSGIDQMAEFLLGRPGIRRGLRGGARARNCSKATRQSGDQRFELTESVRQGGRSR